MNLHIDVHASEVEYQQGQGSYNPNDNGQYNPHQPACSVGMALDDLYKKISDLQIRIETMHTEKMTLEAEFAEHKMKEEEIIRIRNEAKWVDELFTEAEVAAKLVSNG